MRFNAPSFAWHLSLFVIALLPPSTASAKRRRRRRVLTAVPPSRPSTLLDSNSEETLRERWVDILSLELDSNSIRMDNRREKQYFYETELLADQLLGLNDKGSSLQKGSLRNNSLLSKELSVLWKSIVVASSVMLIGIPVASIFNSILASNAVQSMIASVQSSITPYLVPTMSIVSASVRNFLLQAQAILHSAPYLLRHLHHIRIRPLPFLYKLIRKCIIIEAWRHVWVRVYKLTRYLWRGTLNNARSVYVRLCPAWIRRGIKSYFQSMVQAEVHGVVGGVVGSALGGVTFESWAWSSGGGDGASAPPSGALDSDGLEGSGASDAMVESVVESAAQSLENTIHDAIDSVSEESTVMDALADGMDSATEGVTEGAMDALSEGIESSVESVVESLVEDCLSEGCVDQAVESVLE